MQTVEHGILRKIKEIVMSLVGGSKHQNMSKKGTIIIEERNKLVLVRTAGVNNELLGSIKKIRQTGNKRYLALRIPQNNVLTCQLTAKYFRDFINAIIWIGEVR